MSFAEGYVEVTERIEAFYAKYPEGSLRCKEWTVTEANGKTFFVYVAQAFRTPDDQAPAEGIAWEPVPGKTPFTADAEAMNAETSAWGRAIAALGFEVKRGIASAQEVRSRPSGNNGKATDGQRKFLADLLGQKFNGNVEEIKAFLTDKAGVDNTAGLSKQQASELIEGLK